MEVNGYKIEPSADPTGAMMPDGTRHDQLAASHCGPSNLARASQHTPLP